MTQDDRLLREEDYQSVLLKEAAARLNFIGCLAFTYRAPELLGFLQALTDSLDRLKKSFPGVPASRH